MSAAGFASGIDAASPLHGMSALAGSEQAIPVRRVAFARPRTRVAVNSDSTFTYNATGAYPAARLFQVSRPLPEVRPFGQLNVDPGPIGGAALLAKGYGRRIDDSGEDAETSTQNEGISQAHLSEEHLSQSRLFVGNASPSRFVNSLQ